MLNFPTFGSFCKKVNHLSERKSRFYNIFDYLGEEVIKDIERVGGERFCAKNPSDFRLLRPNQIGHNNRRYATPSDSKSNNIHIALRNSDDGATGRENRLRTTTTLKIATSFYDRDAIVDLNVLFSVSEKKLTGIAFVLSNMVEDREDTGRDSKYYPKEDTAPAKHLDIRHS